MPKRRAVEEASGAASQHPRELRRKAQAAKKKSKTVKGAQVVQQDDDDSNSDADSDGGAAAEDTFDAGDAPADGEEGEEGEQNIIGARTKISPKWTNRQRTLVFSSRGISYRARHLMTDLRALMPHSKKDAKTDRKDKLGEMIPEICEMKNCNNCAFFEMRKKQDLYMWVGKMPHGPTAKFLVQNVHTMDELKMSGNGLKGSRPLLNFDANFDTTPELKLMKELLFQTFGTPNAHPKSKPFVDRVMSFFWLDNRVWVRNYQVSWSENPAEPDEHELAEIGPRFVMQPIRIFGGAFGGRTLYENPTYVSPNEARRTIRAKAAQKFLERAKEKAALQVKLDARKMPVDEVANVFKDAAALSSGESEDEE